MGIKNREPDLRCTKVWTPIPQTIKPTIFIASESFLSYGIAENCPDFRAAKESENALYLYVKLSYFTILYYFLEVGEIYWFYFGCKHT